MFKRLFYFLLFFCVFSFASEKAIGQTITLTGPASGTVCTSDNFSLTVSSTVKIWFYIDLTTDNGANWQLDPQRKTMSGTTAPFTFSTGPTNNISQTTKYRLRYTTSNPASDPNAAYTNLPQLLEMTLYTTPYVNNITGVESCSGTSFVISPADGNGNIIPVGTRYTWTVLTPNSNLSGASDQATSQSTISQPLINTTNSNQSIQYSITPITTNNCLGDPFTASVLIKPTPTINATTFTVCSGDSYSYSPTNITDGIVPAGTTYAWSLPTVTGGLTGGTVATNANTFSGTLNNSGASNQTATYIITPTALNGCVGGTFSITSTVKPRPRIADNNPPQICSGTSFSFTTRFSDVVPGGTMYTWTVVPNGNVTGESDVLTPTSTFSQTLTGDNSTQTVQYLVTPTANGCDGTAFNSVVTIIANPIINNTSKTVCSGAGFSFTPINGVDGIVPANTQYTWTVDNNTNVTGQVNQSSPSNSVYGSNLVNSTLTNQVVLYTVTSSASNGCATTTFQLTATVVPVAIITNKTRTICSNGSFSITPSAALGDIVVPGTDYTWTVLDNPNVNGESGVSSGTSSIGQTLTSLTNVTQQVFYNVTSVSNGTCAAASFSVTVNINPTPKIAAKATPICSEGIFSVTPVDASPTEIVPASVTYSWGIPTVTGSLTGGAGGTVAGTITGTLTNPTNQSQTATYMVTPVTGSCTGGVFSVTVTVNPKATIADKTATICSSNSFSVIPSNGGSEIVPAGTLYNWTVSNNTNITGQSAVGTYTNTIGQLLNNVTNSQKQIVYTATPMSGNCTGSSFAITVTVDPTPIIGAKATPICSEGTFTVIPVDASPTEIVPASITYSWGNPIVTGSVTGGSNASLAGTISGSLTNPTNLVQTATYSITPIAGSCTGGVFSVTVTVNPKATIADKTNIICSGSAFSIVPTNSGSEIVPSGTLYNWTVSNNSNLTGQSAVTSYTNTIGQTLNNLTNSQKQILYTITPISNNCLGGSFSATITVNPTPVIAAKSTPICSGTSFAVTPADASPTEIVPSGITYTWTVVDNANTMGESGVLTPTSNTISQTLTNSSNQPQIVAYTITPVAGNCPGATFPINVTVNPLPTGTITIAETSGLANNDRIICSNENATISALPVVGGLTDYEYTWSVPVGATARGVLESSFQSNVAGTYSLSFRNISTGCSSATQTSTTLSVNTAPTVGTISSTYNTVCVNSSIQLEGVGSTGGATPYTSYWWYTGNSNGASTTLTSSVLVTGVSAGTGNISYSVLDQLGCMSSRSNPFNITVYALPLAPIVTPVNVVYDGLPHSVNAVPASAPVGNDIIEWYANSSGGSVITPTPNITNVGSLTRYAQAINNTTGCVNLTRASASVTITPKGLTITANDVTKTYDRIAYTGPNSVSYSGFENNETPAVLAGTLTYGGSAMNAINAGTYAIEPSGLSSTNYSISYIAGRLTINKKGLTITGANVLNKIYDATDNATMNAGSLVGLIAADVANVVLNYSTKFPNKNVGNNLPITSTSTISGSAASNYTLDPTINVTASITRKQIEAIGVVTADKVYDGTTTASVTGGGFNTAIDPGTGSYSDKTPYKNDIIQLVPSGTFADKNVANNIAISSTSTISGTDANNYTLIQPTLAARNITPKALAMSGLFIASPKVYNGNTAAIVQGTPALLTSEQAGTGSVNDGAPYTNDLVSIAGTPIGTYNSKDVLTANAVSFSGLSLSGANANNYTLTIQSPYASSILKKALNMFGLSVPSTKVYDGNTSATVGGIPNLYNAVSSNSATDTDGFPIIGDEVSIAGTPVGTYNSKDVISATYVAYSGLTLSGNQASNYALNTQTNSAATIVPLSINVKADAQTKVYGEADPYFTYVSDPLIGSDSFMGALDRQAGENFGEYQINQGTLLLDPNYTIVYTPNKLKILQAELIIQPKPVERTYGDEPLQTVYSSTDFTTTGLKNDETISSVTISLPSGVGSGNSKKDSAGKYIGIVNASNPIPGNIDLNNYKLKFLPGDLIVKKYGITIYAEPKEKRKTQLDPPFTYTVSRPLVEGDSLVGSLTREPGEEVGFYKILQGTVYVNDNYAIKYIASNLEILTIERIIVVPNAFTPNNDGLNDVLKIIHNSTITSINYYKIFDRSGKQIFETRNIKEGWDGKLNGAVAESDAYYWMVEYNTWDNKVFQVKGSFVLIK